MSAPEVRQDEHGLPQETESRSVVRELLASALYLDLVLLGAMAATPLDNFPDDRQVIRLIFGTSIGLLLAHWFAFRLATRVTERGIWSRQAGQEAAAQAVGGMGVAVLAALPFAVLDGTDAALVSAVLLAAVLAVVGVVIARLRGKAWWGGLLTGSGVLAVTAIVVYVKATASH